MDFVEYNILNKMYVDWRRAKAVRGTMTMCAGVAGVMLYCSYYTLYCANDWSSVSTLHTSKLYYIQCLTKAMVFELIYS